ncbi:hypothetical protein [Hymenobacter metallicola]|uniref:Uncharacterized protein n=1 Tax=Hymenobacter metallicola TaxID=2563114 RepID=A0A4Z0QAJ4_9BACT|nr:hypothetical protein [Hymenobacter metallicola]TGE26399.1 hypothetical protein E5K02_16515 [Hymenobacter metallicola]
MGLQTRVTGGFLLLALLVVGCLFMGPGFGIAVAWLLVGLLWVLVMVGIGAFWLSVPFLLYHVLLEIPFLRSASNRVALRWWVFSAYTAMALVVAYLVATKHTWLYTYALVMEYHIRLWLPLLVVALVPAWAGRRRWQKQHPPA